MIDQAVRAGARGELLAVPSWREAYGESFVLADVEMDWAPDQARVTAVDWSSRFRVHHRVTSRNGAVRGARNTALPLLGRLPAFRTKLATELAELNYR